MAPTEKDDELGRRLGAGRGYARESATKFAERLKVHRNEVMAWEKGEFGDKSRQGVQRRKREDAIRLVERASGLPPWFFRIDLTDDLPGMTEVWRQALEEDSQDAESAADAVERAARVDEQSDQGDAQPGA